MLLALWSGFWNSDDWAGVTPSQPEGDIYVNILRRRRR